MILRTKDFGGFQKFHAILERMSKFAYPNEERFNLNGIFLEFVRDKTVLTATDGAKLTSQEYVIENKKEGSFILSLEGIKKVMKWTHDYELEFLSPEIVKINDTEIQTSEKWGLNAGFPDWRLVIQKENNRLFTFERGKLLKDLKKMGFSKSLRVTKQSKEIINLVQKAELEAEEINDVLNEICTGELDSVIEKLKTLGVRCSYETPISDISLFIQLPEAKKDTQIYLDCNGGISREKKSDTVISFMGRKFYDFIVACGEDIVEIQWEDSRTCVKIEDNKLGLFVLMPAKLND